MVESDNAKSKREFRKLSKHMGDKLDKEKGRSVERLSFLYFFFFFGNYPLPMSHPMTLTIQSPPTPRRIPFVYPA